MIAPLPLQFLRPWAKDVAVHNVVKAHFKKLVKYFTLLEHIDTEFLCFLMTSMESKILKIVLPEIK